MGGFEGIFTLFMQRLEQNETGERFKSLILIARKVSELESKFCRSKLI